MFLATSAAVPFRVRSPSHRPTPRTIAARTSVTAVRAPGNAWTTNEPSVGVCAALDWCPRPRGNRTTFSTNAPGPQATNGTISGSAVPSTPAANARRFRG